MTWSCSVEECDAGNFQDRVKRRCLFAQFKDRTEVLDEVSAALKLV